MIIPQPRTDRNWHEKAAKLADLLRDARAEVLMIGDSLAAQWPRDLSWMNSGSEPKKFAIESDRIRNVAWRLNLLKEKNIVVDSVVVFAGTNDITGTKSSDELSDQMLNLVEVINTLDISKNIYVMSIPHRGEGLDYKETLIDECNKKMQENLQKVNVNFIDYANTLKIICIVEGREKFYRDLVHFTNDGYALIQRISTAIVRRNFR